MKNFGFDWMYLTSVTAENLFSYEKLLYHHGIPFRSEEKEDGLMMAVPEKYLKMSDEIIKDFRAGILLDPVNGFNPRYSNFKRGKKIRRVVKQKQTFRGNFLFLLVVMMLMLALQMLMYLRQ